MTESILGRVRAEAYRDGAGQASMVNYDDAFERGRLEAMNGMGRDHKARWWTFGVLCGVALSAIIGALL